MFLLIYSIALSSFKSHDKTKQRFVFRLQKIIHRRLTEHHLIPTVCSCCRYQTKNKKLILQSVLLFTFFDTMQGPFWFRSWKRTSSSNGTLFPFGILYDDLCCSTCIVFMGETLHSIISPLCTREQCKSFISVVTHYTGRAL